VTLLISLCYCEYVPSSAITNIPSHYLLGLEYYKTKLLSRLQEEVEFKMGISSWNVDEFHVSKERKDPIEMITIKPRGSLASPNCKIHSNYSRIRLRWRNVNVVKTQNFYTSIEQKCQVRTRHY
jgi:hypothetical protein